MKRLAVLLTLLLLIYAPVYACSCALDRRPMAEQVAEAKASKAVIFHGRAISTGDDRTVFAVDEAWTPEVFRTMVVYNDNSSCNYFFTAERDYTVFARETDGYLWVSMCGLTTEGFPEKLQRALGPGYFPPDPTNYAALWLEIGGTIWLATFIFLRIQRRKQTR